ncbi:hypothetical protein A6122_1332 [Rathayibacter tritici]|uniref:Uncharacterized protein n=1 Tax=Rathayibacter tritici TaxID=33888 RepID=A0A161J2Z7_9MICO|nr:hypothetical protein A6122_1332 [Rathayibacter tritici]
MITSELPALNDEQRAAREAASERMKHFTSARDALREERRAQIDDWERGNRADPPALRRRTRVTRPPLHCRDRVDQ